MATNSSSSGSSSIDVSKSVFNSFLGWGATTLLLWLLRRKTGSGSTIKPDNFKENNTNQIGSAIPVVLGRAMIKDPLVSYYGDFAYRVYTEEYGMYSRFPWESLIVTILTGILATVSLEVPVTSAVTGTAAPGASVACPFGPGTVTSPSTVTGTATGVTQGSGAQNAIIVTTIVSCLITIFMWLLTRHMGRITIQKGFKYYLGWQHIICWTGDNIGLKRIWMNVYDSEVEESTQSGVWDNNNHVAWKAENPTGIVAHIDDEDMFGGVDQGGGFIGDVRVYLGTTSQPNDSWMISEMSKSENIETELKGLTPKYSSFVTCVIPRAYIGKQVTIPSMWFEIVNYPDRLYRAHKTAMFSLYSSKLLYYYGLVTAFINKQSTNVINYVSGYLNSLDSAVNHCISSINKLSAIAYSIDHSSSAGEIAKLEALKVKNREEYAWTSAKYKEDLRDAQTKLDDTKAEANITITNAQDNVDDITKLEGVKVQDALDALNSALASGDANAIQVAQARYDTAVLQANTSISLAKDNLDYTVQYYNDLIAGINSDINSIHANYTASLKRLDDDYASYNQSIQLIQDDSKDWQLKYNVALSDVRDSIGNARVALNTLITMYPEKEGRIFEDLTSPFVSFLSHGLWHLGRLGDDLNPAEAIYEILRNDYWGCGYDDSRIDIDSLLLLGVTCEEEGVGISCLLNTSSTSGSVIEKILAHINGICYDNPVTGKLTFKLIRADYDVESLPVFDTSNCESLTFTRLDWSETTSNVTATFIDASCKYDESSLMVYDSSNYRITHKISEIKIDSTYFTTPTNARNYAQTSLLSLAYPLSTVSFVCNRSAFSLSLGAPIVITWLPYGLSQAVYRVTDIDYGSLLSGKINVTAVEDVFGFELSEYVFGDDIGWTDSDDNPEVVSRYLFLEYPYELSRSLDTFIYAFSVRPNYKTIYWVIWRFISSRYSRVSKSSEFSIVARTVYGFSEDYGITKSIEIASLGVESTSLIDNKISRISAYPNVYTNVSMQNLVIVDDEIISYNRIELLPSGHYLLKDVIRGVFDTIPAKHNTESVMYFLDRSQSISGANPVCDEGNVSDEQLEITTESATQAMDFDLNRLVSITTTRRSERPSIMANLQFCADTSIDLDYRYNFPSTQVFAHDILFKFYTRNKFISANVISHTEANNVLLGSNVSNRFKVSCNLVDFELTYPATDSNNVPVTDIRMKWADFCSNMGSRLALRNDVILDIFTYDSSKELYSHSHYNKKLYYVVPTVVGVIDETIINLADYAKSITQSSLIVVPDSPTTPQFTLPFANCGLILSGTRVSLTDVVVGAKILGQDGYYYDVTSLNAYRVCGLDTNGEPILYKITIDEFYVIQSHFTQHVNNYIDSFVWRGNNAGWITFTPYTT